MKANVFKNMIIALCAMSFVSCDPNTGCPPPRSYLKISGFVRNETGEPLNSIRISVDSATLYNIDKPLWEYQGDEYTYSNGEYGLTYSTLYGDNLPAEKWPREVIITATDTSGIYETQSQPCPVSVRARNYKDKSIERLDGYVTADFVMKKK